MKMYNLKYMVVACVMLYNLYIAKNDSYNPPWRLSVGELELRNKIINRSKK